MIFKNKYGDLELFCDECGGCLEDDEEVYDVEEQVLCIFCLRRKFKRKV
jgi:hypothetical protein